MTLLRKIVPGLILFGVLCSISAFLATPFEPYDGLDDETPSRASFFSYLLLPDVYFSSWIGPEGTVSLADRLPILLTVAACLLAAGGWGASILSVLTIPPRIAPWTRLEFRIFSVVIGLSAFSILYFWLGFFQAIPNRLFAWILVGACALGPLIRMSCSTLKTRPENPIPVRNWSSLKKTVFFLGLPVFTLLLVLGGVIPSTDYDVLSYHLAGAREFAESGRIAFLAHNVYANMPFGTEMFVVWGITLTGDSFSGAMVGKTLIALTTVLTALGLYAFGKRFFSENAGSVAMLLYLTTPWIVYVSTAGLIDTVVGMYAFFAIYTVFLYQNPLKPDGETVESAPKVDCSPIGLSGFFAGSAAACKYPAMLFVVVPIGLYIIGNSWIRRNGEKTSVWRSVGIPAFVFSLAVLISCGGWYFKNWYFTDNPVYPLCFSIFGDATGSWNAEVDARWTRVHSPHGFGLLECGKDFWRVLISSPWNSLLIVPLCLPLFGAKRSKKQRTTLLLLFAWILFVLACWWFLTHRIDRFWLPMIPVLCVLAGAGADGSSDRRWKIVLAVFLVLGSVYGFLVSAAPAPGKVNRYWASLDSMRKDPDITTPWAVWLNEHPTDRNVLLVGEAKAFLYDVPVLYSTCWNKTLLEEIFTAPDPVAELEKRNIGLILVDWAEIRRFRSPGNYGFDDFVRREVFDRALAEGILERFFPTQELEESPVVVYRVVEGVRPTAQ